LAEATSNNTVDHTDDPWLSQLNWTPITPKYSSKNKIPLGDKRLYGKPEWYRKYWVSKLGRCVVTVKTEITPLLLKMTWKGFPVYSTKDKGWCYRVPRDQCEEEKKVSEARLVTTSDDKETNPQYYYFKVPHMTEDNANVGSLFSKDYSKALEKGILSSASPQILQQLLSLNSKWSFWTGYRERLARQLAVFPDPKNPNEGFIIPGTVAMGTVTRRAVENTWMTATNPKKHSAGSEQKALVTAPEGWSFVGADVDSQELWISSLLGDSCFGEHGATAMGWMTLQGSRKDNTDLHSRTAQILGMRRDDAKIFTYGRIYGAGKQYAAALLARFNPSMPSSEAKEKADDLYAKTKGQRERGKKEKEKGKLYRGGSESFMFNKLEAIANESTAKTPILGCKISTALTRSNVANEFITSRVNWVVQSSAVDYLHLMLVATHHLAKTYNINMRLAVTIHDELRFLVKNGHELRAAMALQVANLWVRTMFAYRLGFSDLPFSVAFFSLVDIDKVLRKEPSAECITPTNQSPIPPGRSLNIYELIEELGEQGLGNPDFEVIHELKSIKRGKLPTLREERYRENEDQWKDSLLQQIDCTAIERPCPSTHSTEHKDESQNIIHKLINKNFATIP
jgi:DNA polymerase gamma 1